MGYTSSIGRAFLAKKAGFRQKKALKSYDFKANFWQGHKDLNPEPTVLETADTGPKSETISHFFDTVTIYNQLLNQQAYFCLFSVL